MRALMSVYIDIMHVLNHFSEVVSNYTLTGNVINNMPLYTCMQLGYISALNSCFHED